MGRYSEEQWKDLKLKITLFVILAVIGGAFGLLGPGLRPVFLEKARANDDPELMVTVAKIEEWTFRKEKAREVWEEFYKRYAGNEVEFTALEIVADEQHQGDYDQAYFVPWVSREQSEGEPHPLMAEMLLHYAKYWEDKREYPKSRHLYSCIVHCFPDTPQAEKAAEARKRDALRSY